MMWMKNVLVIVAYVLPLTLGLAVYRPNIAESAQEAKTSQLVSIESVAASGDGITTELVVKLSSSVTYTSYKTTAPLRLVIDFSQATQGVITTPILINKGNFKTVTVSRFDTDAGVLTRMDIELVNDYDAVITASPAVPGELHVSFPSQKQPEVEATSMMVQPVVNTKKENNQNVSSNVAVQSIAIAPQATDGVLKSVTAKDNNIFLNVDGVISDFKSFRLNKPERYVVDIIGVKNGLASRFIALDSSGVSSARIGLYPDKIRVVLDSVNGSFPDAVVSKTTDGLTVSLQAITDENKNTKLAATTVMNKNDSEPEKQKSISAIANPEFNIVTPPKNNLASEQKHNENVIESIDFQVIEGLSRIIIKITGDAKVEPPVKTKGYYTVNIINTALPKRLQRSIETQSFTTPVLRITPLVVKSKNRIDAKIRIAMKTSTIPEFRQEGDVIIIEFTNPEGITADKLSREAGDIKSPVTQPAKTSTEKITDIATELAPVTQDNLVNPDHSKSYKGRKVTLEFADAEVRKIFQLLAEVSNKNFVLGDDVTGTISLKLVNVPWDQALEIILDTKGLEKREEGNVVLINGKGKFQTSDKKKADDDLELLKSQVKKEPQITEYFPVNYSKALDMKSQVKSLFDGLITKDYVRVEADDRTNTLIITAIKPDMQRVKDFLKIMDVPEKQVMIEARIVEATSTFTKNLGVSWGIHYKDGAAAFMGINKLDTSFGGLTNPAVTSGQSGTPGGNMGISFGTLTSNIQLDMRLNAAASAGLIKIVSTPKVATLNNKTAKITQGQQIPYQNTTATTGATTQFVEAALSLEVTPHINANGTIGMKIDAKNDAPGTGSPPPINKKQATTEMLLRDGETTVIGGIYVDSEQEGDDGVPYLMDVPLLGKLFKSNSKTKTKTELLIFITPRILTAS